MALMSNCLWVVALQALFSEFRKHWEVSKRTYGEETILSKMLRRGAERQDCLWRLWSQGLISKIGATTAAAPCADRWGSAEGQILGMLVVNGRRRILKRGLWTGLPFYWSWKWHYRYWLVCSWLECSYIKLNHMKLPVCIHFDLQKHLWQYNST